uniref:CBFD_NFYB_HMF domain-containing protein n=1 Tax=Rhabditophanes sp. KR3021 TaxID=114890 RepID=A0AC35TTI3_9BILA
MVRRGTKKTVKPTIRTVWFPKNIETVFPLARVKKIMKHNPDVALITPEAAVGVSSFTEKFIEILTEECFKAAEIAKRKTVQRKDLDSVISRSYAFQILEGLDDLDCLFGNKQADTSFAHDLEDTIVEEDENEVQIIDDNKEKDDGKVIVCDDEKSIVLENEEMSLSDDYEIISRSEDAAIPNDINDDDSDIIEEVDDLMISDKDE